MSRRIGAVDRAVLAWIMDAPDPAALLDHVEREFLGSGGRLGYMRTGRALETLSGGRDDLEHVVADGEGMLTGVIQVREDPPALNWERGTLSIWRGGDVLPATMLSTLCGRRIDEVVDHPMLPGDAVITDVVEGDVWLRMTCRGYSVGIEEARAMVTDAASEKGRAR